MDKVINNKSRQRPKFLNLLQIRLPVTAIASILHRISGVILIMVLPIVIYGLGLSLQGEEGFAQALLMMESPAAQLLFAVLVTSIFYHLLAGIRFLLLDIDFGNTLVMARWSARIVIIIGAITLVLLIVGVFKS